MYVTKVSVRRVKTANYCSKGAEVEVTLKEGDDYVEALKVANTIVALELGELPSQADAEQA